MCPIWFLNVGVKLLPFIILNVETESAKINILSSQLLIFFVRKHRLHASIYKD